MKYEDEDIINFCEYCKDNILFKDGYVVKNGKYYHLECYHTIIDVPIEIEADDENKE